MRANTVAMVRVMIESTSARDFTTMRAVVIITNELTTAADGGTTRRTTATIGAAGIIVTEMTSESTTNPTQKTCEGAAGLDAVTDPRSYLK
jgi:hypothetical protein